METVAKHTMVLTMGGVTLNVLDDLRSCSWSVHMPPFISILAEVYHTNPVFSVVFFLQFSRYSGIRSSFPAASVHFRRSVHLLPLSPGATLEFQLFSSYECVFCVCWS